VPELHVAQQPGAPSVRAPNVVVVVRLDGAAAGQGELRRRDAHALERLVDLALHEGREVDALREVEGEVGEGEVGELEVELRAHVGIAAGAGP